MITHLASKMGVASRRLHLEDAVLDGEDGDVKGAATKIEDQHVVLSVSLLIKAIRDRSRGWLVDNPENCEASDDPGVLGRLPLAVVEVGGNGDHRLGDGGA